MDESHNQKPSGWDVLVKELELEDIQEVAPLVFLSMAAVSAAAIGFLRWWDAKDLFGMYALTLITLSFGLVPFIRRFLKR